MPCSPRVRVVLVADHPVGLEHEIGKDMGEEEGGEGFGHWGCTSTIGLRRPPGRCQRRIACTAQAGMTACRLIPRRSADHRWVNPARCHGHGHISACGGVQRSAMNSMRSGGLHQVMAQWSAGIPSLQDGVCWTFHQAPGRTVQRRFPMLPQGRCRARLSTSPSPMTRRVPAGLQLATRVARSEMAIRRDFRVEW